MPVLTEQDAAYLQRCLELANKADASVFPNPKVGAVIVYDGKIIGEGFHARLGEAHAEVNAIHAVKDKSLLSKATIYVSLEPCSHFGRTPPCADLLIKHRISRVVVGCCDINPQVAGKGIARLRAAGLEVLLAENPAPFEALNPIFFCNQSKKRPYIVLKWAETQDKFIAPIPAAPYPISHSLSQKYVHQLRAKHHAIMVGTHTAQVDNPQLNVRHYYGKNPIRIVWDKDLALSKQLSLFQDGHKTIIINALKNEIEGAVHYYCPNDLEAFSCLKKMGAALYQDLGIASILVEGGANVLQQFIDQAYWDEIYCIQSPKRLEKGIEAPVLPTSLAYEKQQIGQDTWLCFKAED